MKKPVFRFSKAAYAISAILTIPLMIDFCTACHLFPLWLAWCLFILISLICCIRIWFAFAQHCYKFAWGLLGQLLLGAAILTFFQLSYNHVIQTPVSNPETPAVIDIAPPIPDIDSIHQADKDAKADKDIKKDKADKTDLKTGKEKSEEENSKDVTKNNKSKENK